MMQRCILEISKRRGVKRLPTKIIAQTPQYLCSRNAFLTASKGPKPTEKPAFSTATSGPKPTEKPSDPGSSAGKIIFGSAIIGAAGAAAYQCGYLDRLFSKRNHDSLDVASDKISKDTEEPIVLPHAEEPAVSAVEMKETVENVDPLTEFTQSQELAEKEEPKPSPVKSPTLNREKVLPELEGHSLTSDAADKNSPITDNLVVNYDTKSSENFEISESTVPPSQQTESQSEDVSVQLPPPSFVAINTLEDTPTDIVESATPLLDAYSLRGKSEEATASLSSKDLNVSIDAQRKEDRSDAYVSGDGKLVLDFLQAIHAAEKRQAELDAHVFAEEKRMMKEKYEKELKDARARELMYAEEAAILDKELNKERAKAIAAMKLLQEKAEEKLRMELEQKEKEAEQELRKIQELAKAELAAAIAREKAAQIEKIAEANLHINALCMAFFARSEEARQTHSMHKLALGAVALEDALIKGHPVQMEIEALHRYLEGVDRDSLVDLVLSSLSEEARYSGTDTTLQLNKKFDALKVTLRHFSLIPPGGGGILAHSLARVASALKVKETGDTYGGVESVISKVDNYLAEGKLVEAADALEEGLKGTQAAEVVNDWVTRARNRAITEQALTLLQSYATSISLI